MFLGLLLYSIGTGFREGWLVFKGSLFLHNVGFTDIDPSKSVDWSEFFSEVFLGEED